MKLLCHSFRGLLAVSLVSWLLPAQAAIVIVNSDGAGEGLNDTTPASAVGGNTGTTLGAQRLNVFNRAADILNATFDISQPVQVSANFDPLYCDSFSATLGSAGPAQFHFIYDAGSDSYTVFPDALLNQLQNYDVDAGTVDINANFNSELGQPGCLDGYGWYLGFDAPSGTLNSLLSVVLHEIIHGMGFLSLLQSNGVSGASYGPDPVYDPYTQLLFDATQGALLTNLNDTQRAASILNDGNLVWDGSQTNAQLSGFSAGVNGARMQMYAPASYEGGSSVSHFDTDATPNELMEPQYTEFLDSAGLARYLLADIGWTLQTANNAPVFNSISAQSMNEDATLDVSLSASDADGDGLSYSIVSAAADFGASISGSTLSFAPTANYHGSGTVSLQVSDGTDTDTTSFVLTISAVNDAPVITPVTTQTLAEDSSLNVTLSATDVDGDSLSFALVSADSALGASVTGSTLSIVPQANYAGSGTIEVSVSDGSATDATSFTVNVTAVNDAPQFTSDTLFSVTDGDSLTITLTASDADSDPLTFSLVSFDSNAVTASLSGAVLTITPTGNVTGGTQVDVSVSDGSAAASATLSINILSADNRAPVWDSLAAETLLAGESTTVTLSATDADGDSVSYSVTSAPAFVSVSLSGSELQIDANSSGSGTIDLSATDGALSAATSLTITVLPAFTLSTDGNTFYDGDTINAGTEDFSFTLNGGDNQLTTTLFYGGSDATGLLSSDSGFTLLLPQSDAFAGAFAGNYALTVEDNSGYSASFLLQRPLRLTTSVSPLLITADTQQMLQIEGAEAGSGISLSSADAALSFIDIDGNDASTITAADDEDAYNLTTVILAADALAPFSSVVTASVANVPDTLTTLEFSLPVSFTVNVTDNRDQPLSGVTVSLSDDRFAQWNLPTSAVTDSSGNATLMLPAESLTLSVAADGYQSRNILISAAQTNSAQVTLTAADAAFTLRGIVSATGFDFTSERPVLTLFFTDGNSEVLSTTTINNSSVRYLWQGDLSLHHPQTLSVSHSSSGTLTADVDTSAGEQYLNINLISSADTSQTTVVITSSSGGGGDLGIPLALLILLLIVFSHHRRNTT